MTDSRNPISAWLVIVCVTIFAMIVVGGITRLTDSGLSMVDWQPIMGIIPPTNDAEWMAAFDAYRQYPEYLKENRGMSLEAFKTIFYWEYGHRVLGRIIGLMYFAPLVVFWLMGRITPALKPRLVAGLVLGGLQGLMGWFMVKSGLVDEPRVSHFRLAAHLSLAMLILSYLFWLVLGLQQVTRQATTSSGFNRLVYIFMVCLVLQIVYGGFVAGNDAGWGYNTYPKMHDQWIADAVFSHQPLWINLFEGNASLQFIHRWLAVVVMLLGLGLLAMAMSLGDRRLVRVSLALNLTVLGQFIIGVLTLVNVVPLGLASLHQAWACVVLLTAVYLVYIIQPAARQVVSADEAATAPLAPSQ